MLQREVAARITAQPSTSDRGYLSVLVEAYAEVEKLFDVDPTAFRPSPKVWSTVVRLKPVRVSRLMLRTRRLCGDWCPQDLLSGVKRSLTIFATL